MSVASASATSVATTAAAAASTTTTAATNKTSKKKNARSIELVGRLVPSLLRRQSEMDALVAKHRALDDELHEKVRELADRQLLTVAMMDEIATAVGTADDSELQFEHALFCVVSDFFSQVPVDALAGQIDDSSLGKSTYSFSCPEPFSFPFRW